MKKSYFLLGILCISSGLGMIHLGLVFVFIGVLLSLHSLYIEDKEKEEEK